MPAFGLNGPAAYVVITTVTAIIWSLLTLGIRVFLRLKVNGPFGRDDAACALATGVGILHSSLTLVQIRFGLGTHADKLSEWTIGWAQFLSWLTNMLYVLVLACSMLSVCFLIARLLKRQRKVWIAYGIAMATASWAVCFIICIAFSCRLPTPWRIVRPRHCINLWAMWASIDATKATLESANIIAAIILSWGLQMPISRKLQVVTAFSVRLLIIPPSLIRLKYTHLALSSKDWSRSRVDAVIITQIIIHLSIILATVPCAKPFLIVFDSGGLHMPPVTSHRPLKPRPVVDGKSTSSLVGLKGPIGRRRRAERWRMVLRPDHSRTFTTIRSDPKAARKGSFESSTPSSQQGILRTDSVYVQYEDAAKMFDQKKHSSGGEDLEN